MKTILIIMSLLISFSVFAQDKTHNVRFEKIGDNTYLAVVTYNKEAMIENMKVDKLGEEIDKYSARYFISFPKMLQAAIEKDDKIIISLFPLNKKNFTNKKYNYNGIEAEVTINAAWTAINQLSVSSGYVKGRKNAIAAAEFAIDSYLKERPVSSFIVTTVDKEALGQLKEIEREEALKAYGRKKKNFRTKDEDAGLAGMSNEIVKSEAESR